MLKDKNMTAITVRTEIGQDDKLKMIENMEKYGGSFVVALSKCFLIADDIDLKKLLKTFPSYVDRYLEWDIFPLN